MQDYSSLSIAIIPRVPSLIYMLSLCDSIRSPLTFINLEFVRSAGGGGKGFWMCSFLFCYNQSNYKKKVFALVCSSIVVGRAWCGSMKPSHVVLQSESPESRDWALKSLSPIDSRNFQTAPWAGTMCSNRSPWRAPLKTQQWELPRVCLFWIIVSRYPLKDSIKRTHLHNVAWSLWNTTVCSSWTLKNPGLVRWVTGLGKWCRCHTGLRARNLELPWLSLYHLRAVNPPTFLTMATTFSSGFLSPDRAPPILSPA